MIHMFSLAPIRLKCLRNLVNNTLASEIRPLQHVTLCASLQRRLGARTSLKSKISSWMTGVDPRLPRRSRCLENEKRAKNAHGTLSAIEPVALWAIKKGLKTEAGA